MVFRLLIALSILLLITLIGASCTAFPIVLFASSLAAILFSFQFACCCSLIFFGAATLYQEFENLEWFGKLFLTTLPIMGGSSALGALIGSLIFPGIGTIIGAVAGSALGFIITCICLTCSIYFSSTPPSSPSTGSPKEYISSESEDVFYNSKLQLMRTPSQDLFDGCIPLYFTSNDTSYSASTAISEESDNAYETESLSI